MTRPPHRRPPSAAFRTAVSPPASTVIARAGRAPTPPTFTYVQKATSDNTRRAYRADVRHFEHWGGRLPATATDIIAYLEAHAASHNARTLARRLTALRQWHRYQSLPDPTDHPDVTATMRGIQNQHGRPKQAAPAVDTDEVLAMVRCGQAKARLVDLRNNALVLVGFFGAFRASELVNLHVEDIALVNEGMDIMVRRSKTDPRGEGERVSIPYGTQDLCAVAALSAWLEASAITAGAVFRRVTQWNDIGQAALSTQSVSAVLQSLQRECGIRKAKALSSHSLRRGLATTASRNGASFKSIMKQGRWKHEGTVLQYIEEGQRFEDNAVDSILHKPTKV